MTIMVSRIIKEQNFSYAKLIMLPFTGFKNCRNLEPVSSP